eukprot:TRINITY_DN8980_c0_g1_i5.p1 TRINITY_DN8980_c0_g1~~TRINITY_DN8980_c0_g1_i5.p1  ORF type:complete len:185 (+),score=36.40 TRINITY_DN8980_c0_g1_i5:120-674(+)
MGLLSLLRNMKKNTKDARILMLGLDNAGKTTILKKLSNESIENVQPTQGFNVKSLNVHNLKLNVWDIGGQSTIRAYWQNYFENTDILIYVVDAADKERLESGECRDELATLLENETLAGVPLLVYCNKMDLVTAEDPETVAGPEFLDLVCVDDRPWHIQGCSAKKGEGLEEGVRWASERLGEKQ